MTVKIPIEILVVKFIQSYQHRHQNDGRHWRRSSVFIVNFEHISHLFLLFLFLNLSMHLFAYSDKIGTERSCKSDGMSLSLQLQLYVAVVSRLYIHSKNRWFSWWQILLDKAKRFVSLDSTWISNFTFN